MTYKATDIPFWDIDWAPDSQRLVGSTPAVVHSATLEGSSEIYIWDPSTDSYLQISDEAPSQIDASPQWHPSDDTVLYYSTDEFENGNIGVVTVNSQTRESISDFGNMGVWFPDGSKIAGEYSNTISALNIETKQRTLLWLVPSNQIVLELAISQDGQQIAIITKEVEMEFYRLFLVKVGNYMEYELFTSSTRLLGLDWSLDGEWIMLLQANRVFAVRVTDGCETDGWNLEIEKAIQDVKWSPDGTRIAATVIIDRPHDDYGVLFVETTSSFINDWLGSGNCNPS